MRECTALLLFESSDNHAVQNDPANEDWIALLRKVNDGRFNPLARRYYMALRDFRRKDVRPSIAGQTTIWAQGMEQAQLEMLEAREQRKANRNRVETQQTAAVFVEPLPSSTELPEALRDLTKDPPPLCVLLSGPGRPPCDALCLLGAFLAAPLLGVDDSPRSVYKLLHSNPSFAHQCGFLGRGVLLQPGELTSRRLPSQAVCAEFSEVMTRYGLWNLARLQQIRANLASGVVQTEGTLVFDTTHVEANSHCAHVIVANSNCEKEGKKPKHRKVSRMRKRCRCGQGLWEECEHPWVPTDDGAAVVVKGATRIYWAHKASVASFADSEVPIDVRVCQYAAQHDGKTLVPHLELLMHVLPGCIRPLQYVLADDAYRDNQAEVARFGQQARLITPVHGRKASAGLAQKFDGISHFTPAGVPVCETGHRFEMRGRDITSQRYIWVAPDNSEGQPVCNGCPNANDCLGKGSRRHIRVSRAEQPQINWEHPQHFARNQARYRKRTGVERAIKRLKVDLRGEHLTHRDALRVQAHLDRKLLTLHLLLSASA